MEKICAVEDIMRWREVKEEGVVVDNKNVDQSFGLKPKISPYNIESNAKIVKWSDGSYSLAIGDEFFEISVEALTNR